MIYYFVSSRASATTSYVRRAADTLRTPIININLKIRMAGGRRRLWMVAPLLVARALKFWALRGLLVLSALLVNPVLWREFSSHTLEKMVYSVVCSHVSSH